MWKVFRRYEESSVFWYLEGDGLTEKEAMQMVQELEESGNTGNVMAVQYEY